MEILILILLISSIALLISSRSYQKKIKILSKELEVTKQSLEEINNRFKPVVDLESHLTVLSNQKSELEEKVKYFKIENDELEKINKVYQDDIDDIVIYGFYDNKYSFESSEIYKSKLQSIREQQKILIKNEKAVLSKIQWTVRDSQKEGDKITKNVIKLILMAFNGESDSIIFDVKFNNINKYIEKIKKLRDTINKLVEYWGCEISDEYLNLKLAELELMYEYKEKIELEKEEQRMIKEQMREEEKAVREAERAKNKAIEDEKNYRIALEKAKEDLGKLQGKELDSLNEKIRNLELQLQESLQAKERAISMAQQTKCGHVYIISNIGSFGDDVYKIGMTRRLDPMDRIYELGDASVPFEFDVHALVYSENAPELESTLHKHFDKNRINLVNNKKEFFKASINEIKEIISSKGYEAKFTLIADAKEYRETLALKQSQRAS